MRKRTNPSITAMLVLSVMLVGCRTTQVEMPTTPAGLACAEQCDIVRNTCVSDAQFQARTEDQQCGNDGQVQSCLDRAVDDRTQTACEAKRETCYPQGANTGPCEEPRILCVLGCGGRLLKD